MYKKLLLTLIVISVFFLCEDIFDRRQFLIFLFVFSFCYTTLQVKYWQLFNRMTHYMLTYCNCCLHSCCIFRQIYKDICTYVQVLSMYLKTHLWFNVVRISQKLTRNFYYLLKLNFNYKLVASKPVLDPYSLRQSCAEW